MRYLTSTLVLVAIVSVGYFALSNYVKTAYGQTNSNLITTDSTAGATTASGAEVLALLNRLQGITLNGGIFTTDAFKSLQDWSISITPEPAGRSNPYLPTGAVAAVTSKSAKATTPLFTN